jgi:Fe-Mn family superoxide dismutase
MMTAPFTMKPLPYADDALDPVITAQTIGFHYGKHHTTYLNTLNKLVGEDASLQGKSLVEIIKATHGTSGTRPPCSTTRPRSGTTISTGTA